MQRDHFAKVDVKPGFLPFAITAAGAGDASEVTGPAIDRYADNPDHPYLSASLMVDLFGTLASGETATVAANFQDSPNNSDWTDYGTALGVTTVLNAAGGALTASGGATKLDVDLSGAARYIRVQATVNLSRAGTDTAMAAGVVALGGPARL